MKMKAVRIALLILTLIVFHGTLAESMPPERPRTELVVDVAHEELISQRHNVTKHKDLHRNAPGSLKRVLRHTAVGLLVFLALCGIPFMLPRRPEQDVDNETKTEIVEGSEESDKD